MQRKREVTDEKGVRCVSIRQPIFRYQTVVIEEKRGEEALWFLATMEREKNNFLQEKWAAATATAATAAPIVSSERNCFDLAQNEEKKERVREKRQDLQDLARHHQ